MTGEVGWFLFEFDERSRRNLLAGESNVRELRQTADEFGFEVGADYAFQLGAEYSEISQSGEFGQPRDFVRPKGFASLNWGATDKLDVLLQIDRRVGQLEFFDVIATVNVNQDRVNVTKAELVPPQNRFRQASRGLCKRHVSL